MTIEFNTNYYEWNTGRKPKGYGVWGFSFKGHEVFAPSSTYGEAKKWCKAKVKELVSEDYVGTVMVKVLP